MRKATSVPTDISPVDFSGSLSPKGILLNKDGISASLTEVLGAVGISIGIMAAAAFGIGAGINFSQDGKAKSSLNAISAAETLYKSNNDTYGDIDALTSGDAPALTQKTDKMKITVSDTNYCAVVKSTSMTGGSFWVTAKSDAILKEAPTAAEAGVTCPTI